MSIRDLPLKIKAINNGLFFALTGEVEQTRDVMHEITLCQRALEIVEQQALANHATRVSAVWLKIGAFSCVEPASVSFCFELVCRGTIAEGCQLHIEEQLAECWCPTCQKYVQLLSQHVRRCPDCGSDRLRIVADDGFQIQRIEVIEE